MALVLKQYSIIFSNLMVQVRQQGILKLSQTTLFPWSVDPRSIWKKTKMFYIKTGKEKISCWNLIPLPPTKLFWRRTLKSSKNTMLFCIIHTHFAKKTKNKYAYNHEQYWTQYTSSTLPTPPVPWKTETWHTCTHLSILLSDATCRLEDTV